MEAFHRIFLKKITRKQLKLTCGDCPLVVCPLLNYFSRTCLRTFVEDRCFFPYILAGPVNTSVQVKVKVAQSCLTLCDTMDYTVHGILQARILEWVAVPFFRGSSQPRD